MNCNKCWRQFDTGGTVRAVATSCGHLFCSSCSDSQFPILEKDGNTFVAQCPVCDEALMKSNLKVVPVQANPQDIKMALFGQTPEAIMHTALAAINFYTVQQQVVSSYREERLADKAIQMKEQCNKKLAEVHTAYQNAKRKYQVMMQEKVNLEQESLELQEKYKQKSKQNKELQQMYKELQMRNDAMRRNSAANGGGGNGAVAVASLSPMSGHHTGGRAGNQMVTTIHRTQVFSNVGGSMSDLIAPSDQGMFGNQMITGGHQSSKPSRRQSLGGGMMGGALDVRSSSPRALMASHPQMQQRQGAFAAMQQAGRPAKLLPGGAIGQAPHGGNFGGGSGRQSFPAASPSGLGPL